MPDFTFDRDRLTFETLRNVLPIGATDRFERFNTTVHSIESYTAGFVVNVEFELHVAFPPPKSARDRSTLPPELQGMWQITSLVDNLGHSYSGRPIGGHGGGQPDGGIRLRTAYVVAPGLREGVQTLTFTWLLVGTPKVEVDENGHHQHIEGAVLDGPWTTTIAVNQSDDDTAVRVVPVGQQMTQEGTSLTVLSLEQAPTSFQVNARLDWTGMTGSIVNTRWSATDNLGNTYRTSNCAGGGGHFLPDEVDRPHPLSYRMHCVFARPIHPDATQLKLSADRVSLKKSVWDETKPSSPPDMVPEREFSRFSEITIDLT